ALAEVSYDLLYTFFHYGVSLILISNVFDWVDDTDIRIQSRAKTNRVDFGAYTKEQMTDILEFIADEGLKKGVMSKGILEKIADQVIKEFTGDVRKGKHLIYSCVDEAMKEGVRKVTVEHLARAYKKVEPMSLVAILKNFSFPELVGLAGFVCQRVNRADHKYGEDQPATTENVHHFYEKCAELNDLKPVREAMMKNHLKRLEAGGILAHETKSHKTRGRTNVYYSKHKAEDLVNALEKLGINLYGSYGTGLISTEEFFRGSK
ncbi:MAG: hypothetical protein OEZ48_09335, partial [Candidatus Bathyarchaeota archaeon]|nr:hypothetical protein [Candidatus Bathyarchaeota archaeon]